MLLCPLLVQVNGFGTNTERERQSGKENESEPNAVRSALELRLRVVRISSGIYNTHMYILQRCTFIYIHIIFVGVATYAADLTSHSAHAYCSGW